MIEKPKGKLKTLSEDIMMSIMRLFLGKHEIIGFEKIDQSQPFLLCGNHHFIYGAIANAILPPHQARFTINHWMLDKNLAKEEIKRGLIGENWHNLPASAVAKITSPIIVKILNGTNPIPVHHDMRAITTIKEILAELTNGGKVLIFPEKGNYKKEFGDITEGSAFISQQYKKSTGKDLPIYCTYASKERRTIQCERVDVTNYLSDSQESERANITRSIFNTMKNLENGDNSLHLTVPN